MITREARRELVVDGGRREAIPNSSRPSLARLIINEAKRRPLQFGAFAVFLAILAIALVGPALPLADPNDQNLLGRLSEPMSTDASGTFHIAGTDQLGRDVLSRVVSGARVSIGVALVTVALAGIIGSTIGLIAGYYGGIVDQVVMRLIDLQMAFPSMLIAIFLLYLLGSNLTNLVFLLVLLSWVGFARMARAQTLTVKTQTYVESAQVLGCHPIRILLRHILPQLAPVLLVIAVFDFAGVMLAEAGLSFLGLGVQPPDSSWGRMIAEGQQFVYSGGWWLFLIPGLAIFVTVLSAKLSSDLFQEWLGPTAKR